MKHPIFRILVLLIAVGTLSSCAGLSNLGGKIGGVLTPNHENDFRQVGEKLESDAAKYKQHLLKVVEVVVNPIGVEEYVERIGADRAMTVPQFTVFAAAVKNVPLANQAVKADMKSWAETGVRPSMLKAHIAALEKAQNEVNALVDEVKP